MPVTISDLHVLSASGLAMILYGFAKQFAELHFEENTKRHGDILSPFTAEYIFVRTFSVRNRTNLYFYLLRNA